MITPGCDWKPTTPAGLLVSSAKNLLQHNITGDLVITRAATSLLLILVSIAEVRESIVCWIADVGPRPNRGKRGVSCARLAPVYSWFTKGFGTADLQAAKALLVELV